MEERILVAFFLLPLLAFVILYSIVCCDGIKLLGHNTEGYLEKCFEPFGSGN